MQLKTTAIIPQIPQLFFQLHQGGQKDWFNHQETDPNTLPMQLVTRQFSKEKLSGV